MHKLSEFLLGCGHTSLKTWSEMQSETRSKTSIQQYLQHGEHVAFISVTNILTTIILHVRKGCLKKLLPNCTELSNLVGLLFSDTLQSYKHFCIHVSDMFPPLLWLYFKQRFRQVCPHREKFFFTIENPERLVTVCLTT